MACQKLLQLLLMFAVESVVCNALAAEIVVGQVAPLSGPEAAQGKAYSVGLQLALDAANKSGAANRHAFTLVSKDDGGRADDTVALTSQLLTAHQPIALAGYFGNQNMAAVIKSGIFEKEKIPLIGYRASSIELGIPYVYSIRAGLREEVSKVVGHLATVGVTKLGLFYENNLGAPALVAAVEEVIKQSGATITSRAVYSGGKSVSPAVETFLKQPPQAIIMLVGGQAAASFIEQYRLASGVAQLFAQSGVDIEQLTLRLGEQTMQGIVITQVTPNPYKISVKLSRELSDIVQRNPKLGVPISYAMMEGFIAGKVIVETVRRISGKVTREAFISTLEAMKSYDLGGYVVSFGPGVHLGSKFVELSIVNSDGKIRQ